MVATPVFVLLQVPPATELLKEVVPPPLHTTAAPDMAAGVAGSGFTVTTFVTAMLPQVFDSV